MSSNVTAEVIGRAVGCILGTMAARAEAIAILRRMEVEPGPDPIQQVIDLAHDIAELLGDPVEISSSASAEVSTSAPTDVSTC